MAKSQSAYLSDLLGFEVDEEDLDEDDLVSSGVLPSLVLEDELETFVFLAEELEEVFPLATEDELKEVFPPATEDDELPKSSSRSSRVNDELIPVISMGLVVE
jgi:hypothetical protein